MYITYKLIQKWSAVLFIFEVSNPFYMQQFWVEAAGATATKYVHQNVDHFVILVIVIIIFILQRWVQPVCKTSVIKCFNLLTNFFFSK